MDKLVKTRKRQGTIEPNPVDIQVGERLKNFRKICHISQAELAAVLGITSQQVLKYEKGINRISASMLAAMADYFKLPVQAFFDDNPVPVNPSMLDHDEADLLKLFQKLDTSKKKSLLHFADYLHHPSSLRTNMRGKSSA